MRMISTDRFRLPPDRPGHLFSLELGDIDNDNDVDVISGVGSWYRNNGMGEQWKANAMTFLEHESVYPQSFQLVDVDGDGDLDVLSLYTLETLDFLLPSVVWFENQGQNGLLEQTSFGIQLSRRTDVLFGLANSTTADSDNIVVVSSGYLVMNDRRVILELKEQPSSLAIADLDADGLDDLIYYFDTDHGVYWSKQVSDHVFADPASLNTPAPISSAYATDVDGDGDADLVNPNGAYINDDLSFSLQPGPFDGGRPERPDFNGDGKRDTLQWNTSSVPEFERYLSTLHVQLSDDERLGERQLVHEFDWTSSPPRIVDVDSDGIDEIVWTDEVSVFWFKSTSNGEFTKTIIPDVWLWTLQDLDFGDIDQDGMTDLVYLSGTRIYWRRGLGHGEFSDDQVVQYNQRDVIVSSWRSSDDQRILFDMDGDGDLDLLLPASQYAMWVPNTDGKGTFGSYRIIARADLRHFNGYPLDLDSDGDLDIAMTSAAGDLQIYEYVSPILFQKTAALETRLTGLDYGDVDGDGDVDIFVNDHYFENQGDNTFEARQYGPNPIQSFSLADFDQDGDVDVAAYEKMPSSIPVLRWYQDRVIGDSNYDGVFDSTDLVAVFQQNEYEDSVAGNSNFDSGDWNQDGEFDAADLVFAFQSENFVFEAISPRLFADHQTVEAIAANAVRQNRLALDRSRRAWIHDDEFDTTDLVFALQADSFEIESNGHTTGSDRSQPIDVGWSMHIDQQDRGGKPGSQGGKYVFIC